MGMFASAILAAAIGGPVAKPAPIGFLPAAVYKRSCASCHGDSAKMIADGRLKMRPRRDLNDKVKEMGAIIQPPLKPDQSLVMTDLLLSWESGRPFLAIVRQEGAKLRFEATPGTTVQAAAKGSSLSSGKDSKGDYVSLPAGAGISDVRFTLRRGKTTVTLDGSRAAWTRY